MWNLCTTFLNILTSFFSIALINLHQQLTGVFPWFLQNEAGNLTAPNLHLHVYLPDTNTFETYVIVFLSFSSGNQLSFAQENDFSIRKKSAIYFFEFAVRTWNDIIASQLVFKLLSKTILFASLFCILNKLTLFVFKAKINIFELRLNFTCQYIFNFFLNCPITNCWLGETFAKLWLCKWPLSREECELMFLN